MYWVLDYFWNLSPRTATDMETRCAETIFVHNDGGPAPRKSFKQLISSPKGAFLASFYLYLILGFVRCLIFSLVLWKSDFTHWYFDWDPLVGLFARTFPHVASVTAGLFVMPLPVFVLYIDYVINCKRFNYIIRLPKQLMVDNSARFFQLNPDFRPRLSFVLNSPLKSCKQCIAEGSRTVKMFLNPPNRVRGRPVPLGVPKLRHVPNLLMSIRIKTILINWYLQLFYALLIGFTGLYY